MTKEEFSILKDRSVEDLTLTDHPDELMRKNLQLPGIKQVYIEALKQQASYVEALEQKKSELLANAVTKVKKSAMLYSIKETREQAEQDPEIVKINKELIIQKYYLNWLEATSDNINTLGFAIKNWIEWRKITSTNF